MPALLETMTPQLLARIAAAVLTGAALLVLLDHFRKPKWWLGRLSAVKRRSPESNRGLE
jgi:hypothetical protein